MPQPPAGQDYFLVIGLADTASGIFGAAQVFVVTGANEEEAVAKLHAFLKAAQDASPPELRAPLPKSYLAQVAPTFDPPST